MPHILFVVWILWTYSSSVYVGYTCAEENVPPFSFLARLLLLSLSNLALGISALLLWKGA